MRLILNILWIILGGFVIWLEYVIAGLLLCLTVVGIPFGLQSFKLAGLGLLPFGKQIERDPDSMASGCIGSVMNVIWFIVGGIWIFLSHVILAIGLGVTIIGIPFALQHVKLASLALTPFGRKVVDDD